MKKLFIVGNWKSNKTIKETEKWLHDFSDGFNKANIKLGDKKVIIAPPFTSLEHAHYCSGNLKLSLEFAAQDVSPLEEGSYTGEVSARQIKELADYVIIGHSERRTNFYENGEMIKKKITISRQYRLTSILCVSDLKQIHDAKFMIHNSNCILAYEPLSAIGSGLPDTPQNAESVAAKIKEIVNDAPVLYGGSVTSLNVNSFTKMPSIDGVLVGGASLDPLEFLNIVQNA